MSGPSLWERLRRARIVQVLAVYLGASWMVIQVTATLTESLHLPDWVVPVELILLLIGMVVILATAWVQSHPMTDERQRSGALPTEWQIAPGDAIASLRSGRIPHLTWGRAIAGGVVALSVLFGAAGFYVGVTGNSLSLGPSEATATEAAEGIAVVPFEVRGADLEIWREGMMDLLTNGLDGLGGFRTIDARTVMARWQDQATDGGAVDMAGMLRAARETGARFVVEGSVVGLGPNVRLAANVYEVESGREIATAQAEGPQDDVLRLVDELAVNTMRSLLLAVGRAGSGDLSAETITTASLPAMRAFLEGETHYRHGRFADAVQAFERAIAADTSFAIALVRLSESYGWLENQNSERMAEIGDRAMAHADRLSPRYQFIMEGWNALNHGTADGVESLKEAVRKYPDDPEAWFLLAETYIHVGGATYGSDEELWEALQRATTLDPNFAPYLVHVAEFAVLRGDRQGAEQAMARYLSLTGTNHDMGHIELAIRLLLGTEAERAEALRGLDGETERTLDIYGGTFARRHEHFDLDAAVDAAMARVQEVNRAAFQGYYAGGRGEVARAMAIMADPAVTPSNRSIHWAFVNWLWGTEIPVAGPAGTMSSAACDDPQFSGFCHVIVGIAAARVGRWGDHASSLRRLREESAAAADSTRAENLAAGADVVEGAGAWRRGQMERGRLLLERHARSNRLGADWGRTELAWLETAAGRPVAALPHFRSVLVSFGRADALYGMATTLERLDQPEEAREYWARFVELTDDADDLPRVAEARAALARLAGENATR